MMKRTFKHCREAVDSIAGTKGGHKGRYWFTIPLPPVPCPRPRVTRAGFAYYPKTYTHWKRDAMQYVDYTGPLLEGPLGVGVVQLIAPPKTVVREYPRYDLDNYLKSVLDLVTSAGTVWKDDDQVVQTVTWKRFTEDNEDPQTFMYIRQI